VSILGFNHDNNTTSWDITTIINHNYGYIHLLNTGSQKPLEVLSLWKSVSKPSGIGPGQFREVELFTVTGDRKAESSFSSV
jgi:hypothetical protein